jgi:hypothetical protein
VRSLIFAQILIFAPLSARAENDMPVLSAWKLRLPLPIERCMKASATPLSPWKSGDFFGLAIEGYPYKPYQTPSAVIGDFDGDGAKDAAIYGRRQAESVIAVVFARGKLCETKLLSSGPYENPAKIRVHFGDKSGYGLTTTLERAAPKIYASPHEKSTLPLKHDAVIVRDFGKAATLYHYANGGFASFALED